MAENETLYQTEPQQPETEQVKNEKPKNDKGAVIKEWFRKKIVNLKRAPQNITFVFLVITSFLYLIWLFTFSKAIYITQAATWTGIAVFVNTLLSILVLALFLNAFPKRKSKQGVYRYFVRLYGFNSAFRRFVLRAGKQLYLCSGQL